MELTEVIDSGDSLTHTARMDLKYTLFMPGESKNVSLFDAL